MSLFREHAENAAKKYAHIQPRASTMVEVLKSLLSAWLKELPIHTIQGRAKSVDSFTHKAIKPSRADASRPRYPDPLVDITDFAGIRIITYFPDTIPQVEKILAREFEVVERRDKSREFDDSGKLGYQSVHFLVKLAEPRVSLKEHSAYSDLVAEIQVRTILQHAWAEMEHDIEYKSAEEIPTEIRRRFAALAGLIEIADREFQAIQDADTSLRKELQSSLVTESAGDQPHAAALIEDRSWTQLITRYDELIERQRNQYTHYLGRAKVKFLSGDRTGALADLESAEKIAPNQEQVALAKRNIGLGLVNTDSDAMREGRKLIDEGLSRLSQGEAEEAVESIAKALPMMRGGLYASFDYALVLCAAKRFEESRAALSMVTPIEGAFLRVNVEACKAIIDAMSSERVGDLTELDAAIAALGSRFNISFSPLRHFKQGASKLAADLVDLLAPVFLRLGD
jgi:ppGpp synthetase/RelA/SpoT-type nucleotidyltranferase